MTTEITTDFWGNDVTIPVDVTSPKVQEIFTDGNCGTLARALYKIAGTPVILTDHHAAVIDPNGDILDIEGVHTIAEFELTWGRITDIIMHPQLEKVMKHDWGSDNWGPVVPIAIELIEYYKIKAGF